jgi:hypothetical protein
VASQRLPGRLRDMRAKLRVEVDKKNKADSEKGLARF